MQAGYSGTPLVKKLGLRPGMRVWLLHVPDRYEALLGGYPAGLLTDTGDRAPVDFIQYFVERQADLERDFSTLKSRLAPDGILWISWPKRSSKRPTDVTEDTIRSVGLAFGLVDVKVCAVDVTWSALKFVYRRKDR